MWCWRTRQPARCFGNSRRLLKSLQRRSRIAQGLTVRLKYDLPLRLLRTLLNGLFGQPAEIFIRGLVYSRCRIRMSIKQGFRSLPE